MPLDLSGVPSLMQQVIADDKKKAMYGPRPVEAPQEVNSIPVGLSHVLGGIADVGSTYAALKHGNLEGNRMFSGIGSPAGTAGAVAASVPLSHMLISALSSKFPKLAPIANAIEANKGAQQLTAAAHGNKMATPAPLTPGLDGNVGIGGGIGSKVKK